MRVGCFFFFLFFLYGYLSFPVIVERQTFQGSLFGVNMRCSRAQCLCWCLGCLVLGKCLFFGSINVYFFLPFAACVLAKFPPFSFLNHASSFFIFFLLLLNFSFSHHCSYSCTELPRCPNKDRVPNIFCFDSPSVFLCSDMSCSFHLF